MDSKIIEGSGTATGTDTYAVELSVGVDTLRTKGKYLIFFTNTSTGASTLDVNSIGAKAIENKNGTPIGVNGLFGWVDLVYDGTKFVNMSESTASVTHWTPVDFDYTDFQTAALTNTVTIYTLADGEEFTSIRAIPTVSMAGTGITDVKISVGLAAAPEKYIPDFDADQTADSFYESSFDDEMFGTPTAIIATITAVGANLDQLSAGDITFKINSTQS